MTKRSEASAFQLEMPELGSAINTEAMSKIARSAITTMVEFNEQFLERAAAVNREWTEFLTRRFKEDVALPQRLTSCKNAEEAQNIYFEFWATAVKEYQEEFFRLAQIGRHDTREAAGSARSCANVVTHEARPN